MARNPDTQVNPFNAYGIPAFQFQPAAVGTSQLCACCGRTRAWASFHNEKGLYVCSVCTAAWNTGTPFPSDTLNFVQSAIVQAWRAGYR